MSGGAVISIDDVVEECVRQRKCGIVKSQVYLATQKQLFLTCWEALNRWMLFRMEKRQGVDIPNFAKVAWEYFKVNDGKETRCRPVFIPSEGFCNAFKVKYKPPLSLPCLGPVEELNYSKVAIKHSKSLTKDVLFVGLRDILRKIGELIAANKADEIRVAFSVGYLVAKDRRVSFEFDAAMLTTSDGGAPFDVAPISVHRGPATGRSSSVSIPSSARMCSARSQPRSARAGSAPYKRARQVVKVPPMVTEESATPPPIAAAVAVDAPVAQEEEQRVSLYEEEEPAVTARGEQEEEEGEGEGMEQKEEEEVVVTSSGRTRPLPEMARLPLEKIGARPHTTGSHRFPSRLLMSTKDPATAEVLKQGYQRYMYALRGLAEEDKAMREVCDSNGHAMEEKEKSKKTHAAQMRKDVQSYILTQIERRDKEKQVALAESKEFSSTTIPLKPDPRLDVLAVSKKELIQTLEQQIKYKEHRVSEEKCRRLHEEQRFLEHINEELKLQAKEKSRRKQETRTMLKATWDMEAEFSRCKELLKKRGGGAVLEHLQRSGLERTILTPSSTDMLARNAVGYDSRR